MASNYSAKEYQDSEATEDYQDSEATEAYQDSEATEAYQDSEATEFQPIIHTPIFAASAAAATPEAAAAPEAAATAAAATPEEAAVVGAPNTPDGRGLAQYPAFPSQFTSIHDASEYLRKDFCTWEPVDQSVPDEATQAGKDRVRQCAIDIYTAMIDMSVCNDNMPEPGKRRLGIMVPGKVPTSLVEARAWELVGAAIDLHKNGSSLSRQADISTKDDRNLDFDERIYALCETFRAWKTCAQDVLDGSKLKIVVHAPKTSASRKANNQRNNIEKGKDLKERLAARKATGERRATKRGRVSSTTKAEEDEPDADYEIDYGSGDDRPLGRGDSTSLGVGSPTLWQDTASAHTTIQVLDETGTDADDEGPENAGPAPSGTLQGSAVNKVSSRPGTRAGTRSSTRARTMANANASIAASTLTNTNTYNTANNTNSATSNAAPNTTANAESKSKSKRARAPAKKRARGKAQPNDSDSYDDGSKKKKRRANRKA